MNRYIATTLPYVNASPHVGFALEIVQADVLARTWRLQDDTVFFSTGTDEHGQKIFEAAEKAGDDVQTYVDRYAGEFHKLMDALNISNDAFIRTTNNQHVLAAQELWRRCAAKGDIYKKTYSGLYCVGCESFKTEKELEGGACPLHPNAELKEIAEENYFFKFSAYQSKLLDYLNQSGSIVPEWRRKEAISFVQDGLDDFSISRDAARLSWGIPVPDDESQVMYVWFDALTNYISTLGWPGDTDGNFNKFWTEGHTLQMAGKDQVRFQSLMWQAMLTSADVKNTDQIFYHGFITSNGQKMSKSIGNVINPHDLVIKYGTDALRYLLLRHVSPVDDSDLTHEAVHEHYTAHLVNGLGNLVARVMKLAETHLLEPITRTEVSAFPKEYTDAIGAFRFNDAMDVIWAKIAAADERITVERPFAVVKEDAEKGGAIIAELVAELYKIGRLLNPFMPATSDAITAAVLANSKPDNLFPRLAGTTE